MDTHSGIEAYLGHKAHFINLLDLQASRLRIDDGQGDGVEPDLEAGVLTLGAWMPGGPCISMVLHELGHLMVVRDEGVGLAAWGMEQPNMVAINGTIHPGGAFTHSQIRLESRVWAWQWLLEEAMGLREHSSAPPERREAQFLDAWDSRLGHDDAARQRALGSLQAAERAAILERHPDPVAAVRARIADLPRLMDSAGRLMEALTGEGTPVEEMSNDRGVVARLYRHDGAAQYGHGHGHGYGDGDGDGFVAWSVLLETEYDSKVTTGTCDIRRARRFLAALAECNHMECMHAQAFAPNLPGY